MVRFEIIGEISGIEVIAVGRRIRELNTIQHSHGIGRWRKFKGRALVRLASGEVRMAEVHWYEAHGIGQRQMKIKRYLEGR